MFSLTQINFLDSQFKIYPLNHVVFEIDVQESCDDVSSNFPALSRDCHPFHYFNVLEAASDPAPGTTADRQVLSKHILKGTHHGDYNCNVDELLKFIHFIDS